MEEDFKLEHIGIAVDDIKKALQFCGSLFHFDPQESLIFRDETQKVDVAFVEAGGIKLELIEPISDDSTVTNFIKRGISLYHLCFQVSDIESALETGRHLGGIVTVQPVPATAFSGNKIAFIYFKNLGLIEYVQK